MQHEGCRPSGLSSFLSPTYAWKINRPGLQQIASFVLSVIRALMCISQGWDL